MTKAPQRPPGGEDVEPQPLRLVRAFRDRQEMIESRRDGESEGDESRSSTRGSTTLPIWARALDVLALASLFVALVVLLSGGFTLQLGPIPFRSHSISRPLLIAFLSATFRHMLAPTLPLHRRLGTWATSLPQNSRAAVLVTALASRVAVLAIGYFAVLAFGASAPVMVSNDPLVNLPTRFDAAWYADIALDGYKFDGGFDTQQNFAFFPAYPMLVRVVGYGIGAFDASASKQQRMARVLWGGVLISIIAFGWAAVYVVRLARLTVGDAHAPGAIALLAAYPFAVFFSAAYSEGLFLLGAAATFYHFRRQEWAIAAIWGALVGLTRPNGCLMSLVLACIVIIEQARGARWRLLAYPAQAVVCAAMPTFAMLAYSAYVRRLTGAWFGWLYLQGAWGRRFHGIEPVRRVIEWIEDGVLLDVSASIPYDTLNAIGLLFALAMAWPVLRRVGIAEAVFVLVNVVPPMLAGSVLSMGRFTSTLFPLFIALSAILPRPFVMPCVTIFAIGQGLVAAMFFTWRHLF